MWSKKELIDKQARFWVLMGQGCTLQAACDAVGVNRRTGRHWRQATGGAIPRKDPAPSGRYLNLDERLQIADLNLAGAGAREIARQLARSASTVSRELHRNGPEPGARSRAKYAPYAAQKRAELRGRRPNFFACRDFTVNSRKAIEGLRLEAVDGPFATGDGPLVSGATLALTMAGRVAFRDDLDRDGVAILRVRSTTA